MYSVNLKVMGQIKGNKDVPPKIKCNYNRKYTNKKEYARK